MEAMQSDDVQSETERVRLAAVEAALRAGCRSSISMPDGAELYVPMLIASEAAVAAEAGRSEAEWREDWTRRLLARARNYPDTPDVLDDVVAIVLATDAIIEDQKTAGIWPWQARPGSVRRRLAG